MAKDLAHIKRLLLAFQIVFLFAVLFIFIGMVAHDYIEKSQKRLKTQLNEAIELVIDEASANRAVSGKTIGPYVFFVMNQQDGSYIVERKDRKKQSGLLWEQYRTKLTYQMQKQKGGWISYPNQGGWGASKDQKLVRYSTVDELGWIIAVEGLLPSRWSLIKDVINRNTVANLFLLVLFGFFVFKFATDHYLAKVEKQVMESSGGSFLDFNQAIVQKTSLKKALKKVTEQSEGEEIKPAAKVKTTPVQTQSKPVSIIAENDLEAKLDQKPKSHTQRKVVETEEQSSPLEIKEDEIVAPKADADVSEKEYNAIGLEGESEGWTVDIKGIKSPVLSKLLKELRDQKQKV